MQATASDATASSPVRGACPHDCPDTCALLTTVRRWCGRASVQGNPLHAHTAGTLMHQGGSRYAERSLPPRSRAHAAQTPRRPQRKWPVRPPSAGTRRWTTLPPACATWLHAICSKPCCPTATPAPWAMVQGEAMAMRFFNRLGASQLDRTVCSTAGGAGSGLTPWAARSGMRVENFVRQPG